MISRVIISHIQLGTFHGRPHPRAHRCLHTAPVPPSPRSPRLWLNLRCPAKIEMSIPASYDQF